MGPEEAVMRYGPEDVNGVIAELESPSIDRPGMQRRRIWAVRLDRAVEAMTVELEALAKVRELHKPQKTDRDPLAGDGEGPLVCGICTPVGRFGAYVGEWPCETALAAGVGSEDE